MKCQQLVIKSRIWKKIDCANQMYFSKKKKMDTQKAINSINYVCHCWPIGIASINAVHTQRRSEFFASLKIHHIHKSYGTIWVIKNVGFTGLSLCVTKSIRIVVVQKYHDVVCVPMLFRKFIWKFGDKWLYVFSSDKCESHSAISSIPLFFVMHFLITFFWSFEEYTQCYLSTKQGHSMLSHPTCDTKCTQ